MDINEHGNEGHIDIVGVIAGHELFLGHANVDGSPYSAKRFQQISSLLHEIAWQLEEEGSKYENWSPRCLRNSLGDTYFEVAPDVFVDADDRQEAEVLYLANTLTVSEGELKSYYPDIELVSE